MILHLSLKREYALKQKPNVVLIVMDTVRADHLSCYGYYRKTTPNIDKIANKGVLFENAFSAASWSPPSHASIFTGKYPSYHRTLGKKTTLDAKNWTIAEMLQHNGYRTIGITNCDLLSQSSGFNKGFQIFTIPSEENLRSIKSRAKDLGFMLSCFVKGPKHFSRALTIGPDSYTYQTNEILKDLLGKNSKQNPFFLFVNYFNCHAPYNPPRPFKQKFVDDFYEPKLHIIESILEKVLNTTGERISHSGFDMMKLKYLAGGSLQSRFSFMAKELQASEKEWEIIRAWYDGEIAYLDGCIGDFVNFLRINGLLENTLIVITADHGENLGDHGLAGHHFCLYDSLLHVPLILYYPQILFGRQLIRGVVSSVDIFPTIMSICNIKMNLDVQGESLYPIKKQGFHKYVCAESGSNLMSIEETDLKHSFWRFRSKLQSLDVGLKSIRDKKFKYIVSAHGEEQLFDFAKDPHEEQNIVNEKPKVAHCMRKKLEKVIDMQYFGSKDIDIAGDRERILNRLKALGYI